MKSLRPADDIERHLLAIEGHHQKIVREIRSMLLDTDPAVSEQLEWFILAFHCGSKKRKLRKRDFLTLSQYKDCTLLVFPDAGRYTDNKGLLEGRFKDGRKLIKIISLTDFQQKKPAIRRLIDQWTSFLTC
jgi:Domain of unknown function (DU1801)